MSQFIAKEGNYFGMNTEISYKVFGRHAELAIVAMQHELLRLENRLSRFLSESEISKINQSAGTEPIKISSETYKILSFALLFSEVSKGLFDVTIAPLVDLWDYKNAKRIPTKSKIKNILPYVDFHELVLNPNDNIAGLGKLGQSIDLGGIGKGYASERCIQILKQFDVSAAYINIGGNVVTHGNKPDGSLWSIGIRHPRQDSSLIGIVKVTSKAVVTSGDYERYFFDWKGKRWHHILNPITGYPAESGLISVTVIADRAMDADALSTAIFVAGMHKGMEFLALFPGVEVILVDINLKIFITQGLKDCFQAVNGAKVCII